MQDYLNHLEKLRKDAAECRLISDLATDAAKRELFGERLTKFRRFAKDPAHGRASEPRCAKNSMSRPGGHRTALCRNCRFVTGSIA